MHPFTANVRKLIAKVGGQEELADLTGVAQGTISRWNTGTIPRKMDAVRILAKYARSSLDDILSREIDSLSITQSSDEILMLPVTLPSEDALTRMFETMLETRVASDLVDELARNLAQRLPGGLAQASVSPPVPVRAKETAGDEDAPPLAKPMRPRRPERRT